ncbi:MAG TPA: hypothetical protein VGE64_02455 [Xanthomonadaceae bacterium]
MTTLVPRDRQLWFGLEECCETGYASARQEAFLRHLHACSVRDGWFGDAWYWGEATIVTITFLRPGTNTVDKTLRIDLFDDRVVVGYDSTHQLTDDLDEASSEVHVRRADCIAELAEFAA